MTALELSDDFLRWYEELQQLAAKSDLLWLVASDVKTHVEAFRKGRSPEEELVELIELAQWRGCGCGGS